MDKSTKDLLQTRLREVIRMRQNLEKKIQNRGAYPSSLQMPSEQQESTELLKCALALVIDIIGPIPISAAARVPDTGDRRSHLDALQRRLALVEPLFQTGLLEVDEHPSSLSSAINEIHAIRMGDNPHLFAKIAGRKIPHRERVAQWRAHILDAIGKGMGLKAGERQAIISTAFGKPWDTIQKWKGRQPVESTPGIESPDFASDLEQAFEQGKTVSLEAWEMAVQDAGLLYRQAERLAAENQ